VKRLTYAVITPVRDEAEHVARLAAALEGQTLTPAAWVIVDTGSTDDTRPVAESLAGRSWILVEHIPIPGEAMRGGPIVRAFHAGLRALPEPCDVIAKVDADTSMQPEYFDRLIAEFERDDRLGIAGGVAHEQDADGVWTERHTTGAGVWGASRAYRRACLDELLPLEERMGWDTIDLVGAAVHGWNVRAFPELPFLHHRREGSRDSTRLAHWKSHGRAAHYMGYRPSYLLLRCAYRMLREPSAIGISLGYLGAACRREPRYPNADVRAFVRREQSLRRLPSLISEVVRWRDHLRTPSGLSGT
jgi:glycosyltransferase involved in cell wall biosynthesis